MIKIITTVALTLVVDITNSLNQTFLSKHETIEQQITDVEKYKEFDIDSLNEQNLIVNIII
ncbi:hypothetical protein HX017_17045 [Myroides marinus]|uniref:Uncharacterized protein n=1 Tax=Myroides marinus TaxID=703342 RepID=A0A1H6UFI5_9FLAO|nr:hypothetical protein [Myroides marinus]KUF42233.1 hypothetical protein AS361_12665 [Myroides marinus]MDM1347653.1 hypothetical protein [Myroides marinus]MDM1352332.1 hypothetical protein [Myroides marinus]MDM1359538.1 hypothetical protein [Myroides marinus]MDM1366641.1 hypothetical protein [Myroides marinus]